MTAELSAAPGIEFPVRIREVAQVADPVTQTFNIRVAMEAPPDIRVLPGMTASVTVAYRRAAVLGRRTLIPVEAIAETVGGEQVAWMLGRDNMVASRPVKLGIGIRRAAWKWSKVSSPGIGSSWPASDFFARECRCETWATHWETRHEPGSSVGQVQPGGLCRHGNGAGGRRDRLSTNWVGWKIPSSPSRRR